MGATFSSLIFKELNYDTMRLAGIFNLRSMLMCIPKLCQSGMLQILNIPKFKAEFAVIFIDLF